MNLLAAFGAIPIRERVIEEGKFITGSGVSAGIDLAIYLVNSLKGEKAAKAAQLIIEYDPDPIFQSGNYLNADKDVIKLAEKIIENDAKKDFSIWEILKNAKTLIKLSKNQKYY